MHHMSHVEGGLGVDRITRLLVGRWLKRAQTGPDRHMHDQVVIVRHGMSHNLFIVMCVEILSMN